jgi:hypothetical protein
MSGRKLRKEGYLYTKLIEPPTAMRRLGAATLKSHRPPFESWRNAYVTLRFEIINSFLFFIKFYFIELIVSIFIRISQMQLLHYHIHYCKNDLLMKSLMN